MSALPLAALLPWLDSHCVQLAPPVRAQLIGGGRSNLTYALTDAVGRRVVVRRPPQGALLATAHDMSREWRFIAALWSTDVPVAQPLAICEHPGVLGAPFYVMSYLDGVVPHDAESGAVLPVDARRRLSDRIVEVLAALHGVDLKAVGLGSMARPDSYLQRQLGRWKRNWDQSSCTDLSVVDEVYHRLVASTPDGAVSTLVHGDYRPGNLLCSSSGDIRAVLDWELATVGDPLADLGWLLADWAAAEGEQKRTAILPTATLEGFASHDQVVSLYADRSGRDVTAIDYYVAFAHWRGACIIAGMADRLQAGVMGDDAYTRLHAREEIASKAERALQHLDKERA